MNKLAIGIPRISAGAMKQLRGLRRGGEEVGREFVKEKGRKGFEKKSSLLLEQIKQAAFDDELQKISSEEEKKKYNRLLGIPALIGAGIPTTITQYSMLPSIMKRQSEMDYDAIINYSDTNTEKIKKFMKAKGVNIHANTPMAQKMVGAYMPPTMPKIIKKINTLIPVYDPSMVPQTGVHISKASGKLVDKDVGILSHELGHYKNFQTLQKLKLANPYMLTRNFAPAIAGTAGLVTAFSKDDKTARNAALIGTAANVPHLTEEATASLRGIRGLTKMYGGLGKALTKGGGGKMLLMNSTYLLPAAVPATVYGIRKLLTGGNKKINK